MFLFFFNAFVFLVFSFNFYAAPPGTALRGLAYSEKQEGTHSERRMYNMQRFMQLSKGLSAVRVEVETLEEIPLNASEEITLRATVIVNQPPPNGVLNYEWHAQEGVQWLEGPVSGQLQDMKAGESRLITATVRGFSKEYSRLVRLDVRFDGIESQIGNSAVVHSRPEDSFEYVAPIIKMQVDQEARSESRGLASDPDNQEQDFKNTNQPGKLKKTD